VIAVSGCVVRLSEVLLQSAIFLVVLAQSLIFHATGLVKKLVDVFKEEFEGIRCRDCQKTVFGREFDFWKEEDQRIFEEMKGHEEKCPEVVGKGASLAAGILWDELYNQERIKK